MSGPKVEYDDIIEMLDKMFGKASLFKARLPFRFLNSYEPFVGFRISV